MDVRNVQLNDRAIEHLECVKNRYRRESERCGVDDDAATVIDSLMDPVD
jgi:hypothetical protein